MATALPPTAAEPAKPLPVDEDEILDWDFAMTPPARPHGTIRVRLVYGGRAKPLPLSDPDADE